MSTFTTDLDMGDIGTNNVVVQYRKRSSGDLTLMNVYWEGLDLIDYISSSVEDMLLDECNANEREEMECAAEAYHDERRERYLLEKVA